MSTAHRRSTRAWGGQTSSVADRASRPDASSASRGTRVGGDDAPELVEISVRDTGPGITQTVLRNLFIPFFTTKAKGTGLGLAISQSIVQNAGGTIDVQTQSGAGTTFTIVLPAANDALITPPPTLASVQIGE